MQLGEFTLNESVAREWLTKTVSYRDAEYNGGDLPEYLDTDPELDLPEDITSAWNPKWADDNGRSTSNLIALAHKAGAITTPERLEVSFDWSEDSDGGYYRYLVDLTDAAGRRLRLASYAEEIRRLADDEDKGVDAAMTVVRDAVREANHQLRQLEAFTARYLQRAQDQVQEQVVEGQGETTDCGRGWPITVYDGQWLHVFNPALTGCDDHDAAP